MHISDNLVAGLKFANEVVDLVAVRLGVDQNVRDHLPSIMNTFICYFTCMYLANVSKVHVGDLAQQQRVVQHTGLNAQQGAVEVLVAWSR